MRLAAGSSSRMRIVTGSSGTSDMASLLSTAARRADPRGYFWTCGQSARRGAPELPGS
jgi:hypothetical protein